MTMFEVKVTRDDDQMLLCPACGGDNVHHSAVVVRSRPGEDQEGIEVLVVGGVTTTTTHADFVGRRDDLEIRIWCETCPARFAIRFVQHKGNTFVSAYPMPSAVTGEEETSPGQ